MRKNVILFVLLHSKTLFRRFLCSINAIMDKVEEALKNGMVGNEDEDW